MVDHRPGKGMTEDSGSSPASYHMVCIHTSAGLRGHAHETASGLKCLVGYSPKEEKHDLASARPPVGTSNKNLDPGVGWYCAATGSRYGGIYRLPIRYMRNVSRCQATRSFMGKIPDCVPWLPTQESALMYNPQGSYMLAPRSFEDVFWQCTEV